MEEQQRARRYVESALDGECAKVAESGSGGRNETLNASAYRLGQLIPNHPVTEDEIVDRLIEAVGPSLDRTMTKAEATYTIRRAMRDGQQSPRPGPGTGGTPSPQRRLRGETAPACAEPRPDYPPPGEVSALWEACLPVDTTADTSTWDHDPLKWIADRGLDADALAAHDLARMIPSGLDLPTWASFGKRDWRKAGYGLVVGCWTADGKLASLHARLTQSQSNQAKTLWPKGHESRGLVFANPEALSLLRGQGGAGAIIVLCEGVPDWLTWAVETIAVFGFTAGGWTEAHARRVLDGSTVVIRRHADNAGAEYTNKVCETFRGRRVTVRATEVTHG